MGVGAERLKKNSSQTVLPIMVAPAFNSDPRRQHWLWPEPAQQPFRTAAAGAFAGNVVHVFDGGCETGKRPVHDPSIGLAKS
jgi:hypothetical protein